MFYQLSGHPLVQSSGQEKLAITVYSVKCTFLGNEMRREGMAFSWKAESVTARTIRVEQEGCFEGQRFR